MQVITLREIAAGEEVGQASGVLDIVHDLDVVDRDILRRHISSNLSTPSHASRNLSFHLHLRVVLCRVADRPKSYNVVLHEVRWDMPASSRKTNLLRQMRFVRPRFADRGHFRCCTDWPGSIRQSDCPPIFWYLFSLCKIKVILLVVQTTRQLSGSLLISFPFLRPQA
jgi:hypothetical protein